MLTATLDLEPVFSGGVKEEVEVVATTKDVFLNGEFFLNVDVSSEITVVSCNKVPSSALGTGVLDDHRAVDVVRVFNHLWHRAAAVLEPLALQCTAALPVEDVSIAEGWDFEVSEIAGARYSTSDP